MFYGTACAILNEKGEILILKRSPEKKLFPGKWSFVTAGPYKSTLEAKSAMKSELKEEAGIEADRLEERDKINSKLDGNDWEIYPFLIQISSQTPIILNEESTEYKWVKLEEIDNYDLVYGIKVFIKKFLNPKFSRTP